MAFSIVKKQALLQIDAAGIMVCVATSLVAYFAALQPLVRQRALLANQRQELATQSGQSSKLKESMLTLKNHLAAVREELAQSKIKLESADRINGRVADVMGFLNDYKLRVDDVQIGKTLADLRCELVPISITGSGGYKQCAAFLHQLHQTFPDISVARFELNGSPTKPEQPCKFDFELFWLAIPEAQEQAGVALGGTGVWRSIST
jgi:Tfp pilus assembly protein PilO